jgi:FMN phosphatase YigB (HAD superfamily)
VNYREPPVPAFLFDLDGTLIDSTPRRPAQLAGWSPARDSTTP